jgi:hypothetical protein
MQHTAHHAIKTRLNMWREFFATGKPTMPDGATDDEYGLDDLIDLARQSDSSELHQIAARAESMGRDYMLTLDDAEGERLLQNARCAAAMMRDDLPTSEMQLVALADLDAVLAEH